MTDTPELDALVERLQGLAAFCRDRGEIKSPELLEQAAATILHGDADHRAWLTEAFEAFADGKPVPPPRGKGNKEARIAQLEADNLRLKEALEQKNDAIEGIFSRLQRTQEVLTDAREAIATLDEDAFGLVVSGDRHGEGFCHYPIRDELLSKIDNALSHSTKEREPVASEQQRPENDTDEQRTDDVGDSRVSITRALNSSSNEEGK